MNFETESTFRKLNATFFWSCITIGSACMVHSLLVKGETLLFTLLLSPVTKLVELVFSVQAMRYANGYYVNELNIWINRFNADLPFFLIIFCVFSFSVPYYLLSLKNSIRFFFLSLVAAYVVSIIANVLQLTMQVVLAELPITFISSIILLKLVKAVLLLVIVTLSVVSAKHYFTKIRKIYAPVEREVAALN